MRLNGVGAFPNARRVRVLWVGLDAEETLGHLVRAIGDELSGVGFPPEKRGFAPHLTLGRCRAASTNPALQRVLSELGGSPVVAEPHRVAAITLMRSQLRPTGAVYSPVEVCVLGDQTSTRQ